MRSDENVARQMIARLSQLSEEKKHAHGRIQAVFSQAWLSYRHETADAAIFKIDSALQHIKGIESDTSLVKFYILKGQCYVKKADFRLALANFTKALQIADQRKDYRNKTGVLISIGWAYMEDGKYPEALKFFHEVLQLNPGENYENRAVVLCNIASCYNTTGQFKLAEEYAVKGIEAARKKNSMADLANGLNILARSNYLQGKMYKAIDFLKEASVAREKVADPFMIASDYLELADLYIKNNQITDAIDWAKKAEDLSLKNDNKLKLAASYETLATAYEASGDDKNSTLYYKKLLVIRDSMNNEHYNQAIAEMQVQFETQKKTSENLELKKENLEAKLENSQQQKWMLGLIAGILLVTGSAIYISYMLRSRFKIKQALNELNEQRNRSMAVMEAEENERKRIAADLHDGVSQILAAASLQLKKSQRENVEYDKVDELINQAGTEVRNVSHQVTPELLLHYGLEKAVAQAIDRLNDSSENTRFTFFSHVEVALQDEMQALMIYRCFQELTNNILKHAAAKKVTVQLHLEAEEIQLMIEDDGVGFNTAEVQAGLGLMSIESRIAIYQGNLVVDSTPGKGTTTIIKINRKANS